MRVWSIKKIIIVSALLFMPVSFMWAAMTSPTYKIPTDTINVGGGDSASGAYNLGDTIGENATGDSSSATYAMHAGFRQMNEGYISISAETDKSLGAMSGVTGGISNASTTWTVITDNAAGYSLSIKAATAPALAVPAGGPSFADYTPSGAYPDYTFTTPSHQSRFGFSPEGVDIIDLYHDNGLSCNTGSFDTVDKCWNGLTTSFQPIAERASSNHPAGTQTTVKYRAEVGSGMLQEAGSYSAEVTVTALML